MAPIILHGFWASSCTWRARAALHHKGLKFEERAVDILKEKHQLTDRFRAVNPAQKVPALEIDGQTVVESMAILQYLEDTRPLPTLTPTTPLLRARMREIVEIIVSGIQPLQNVGLRPHFPSEEQFQQFGQFWTQRGLQVLEELLVKSSGRYCVGDQLSMADLCLVPQVFNAVGRLKLDIGKFPTVSKLYTTLLQDRLFTETHPKIIPVWSSTCPSNYNKLQVIQNKALKTAFNTPFYTNLHKLHVHIGFPKLKDFILQITKRFYLLKNTTHSNSLISNIGRSRYNHPSSKNGNHRYKLPHHYAMHKNHDSSQALSEKSKGDSTSRARRC